MRASAAGLQAEARGNWEILAKFKIASVEGRFAQPPCRIGGDGKSGPGKHWHICNCRRMRLRKDDASRVAYSQTPAPLMFGGRTGSTAGGDVAWSSRLQITSSMPKWSAMGRIVNDPVTRHCDSRADASCRRERRGEIKASALPRKIVRQPINDPVHSPVSPEGNNVKQRPE